MALARVAELADAQDLKSCGVTPVPVRFRSRALYFLAQIAQLVEQRTENPRVTGSIPVLGTFCANGSVVEHRLAKARAASSNLVSRFKKPCVLTHGFFRIT